MPRCTCGHTPPPSVFRPPAAGETATECPITNMECRMLKGEGGTLNAERPTLNAEVGRHGEEGSRLVAPDVRAGTGVEVVQAVIEVEKADLGATPWERKLVEKMRVGHKRAVRRSCTRDLVRPARRAWAGCPCHVVPAATLLRPPSSVLRHAGETATECPIANTECRMLKGEGGTLNAER